MRTTTYIAALFLLALSACKTERQQEPPTIDPATIVRTPAEFEDQEAVWLIWPPFDHVEELSNASVYLNLIETLLAYTKVELTVMDSQTLEIAKAILPAEVQNNPQLNLRIVPSIEIWARDMGPVFVERADGQLAVADFNFNAWGYTDTLDADAQVEEKYDELVAANLGLPLVSSSLITEGGDHELNGKGTMMLVESVEMGRNPHLTKAEIEAEFSRLLGADHFIWLKQGLHEDDHTFLGPLATEDGPAYTVITTNGHIDEFARFVDDTTVLLAEVHPDDLEDPIAQENHRRMEVNFEILQQATDQVGRPLRIIRMPLPKTILHTMQPGDGVYDYISTLDYEDGSQFPAGEAVATIAAASYLNFLITNGAIIGQRYYQPGMDPSVAERDELARSVLQAAFPQREIIMLDALAINLGGGGIHCISKQQPRL